MHMHPTIYRGFAVYLSGADSDWSFRVERLKPDVPLLAHPVSEGHSSWGQALRRAKREIDRILVC